MTDELNAIFGDETVDDFLGVDEAEETGEMVGSYVRIQPSSGYPVDVPVATDEETNGLPGIPLRTVLERSGLAFGMSMQYWAGGAQVDLDYLAVPGTTITAVGNVKGG